MGLALLAILPWSWDAAEAIPSRPTLHLQLEGDPVTLDPAQAIDVDSIAVVAQLYDGLVEFGAGGYAIRPGLARSWRISDDGLSYTFVLKPDAVFHDGRLVTADDVVYSFERLLSSATQSPRRWILSSVEGAEPYSDGKADHVTGIRAVDESTVELRLSRPSADFLSMLCLEAASILPRPRQAGQPRRIGSGPFALESWIPGRLLSLRRAARAEPLQGPYARIVFKINPPETLASR